MLSERLAASAYGSVYRACIGGQRNLLGVIPGADLLANDAFRRAVTDPSAIDRMAALSHPAIVPTLSVESADGNIVVVTRSRRSRVSVQDVVSGAATRRTNGGRVGIPVASAIARAVLEALSAAHEAGIVHGGVHPHSVVIGHDGVVQLDDFILARGVASAFAHGAALPPWRELQGYLAPELDARATPSRNLDLYALGAILFAMLVGQPPPGGLHATPGMDRFIRRTLDAEPSRRYRSASEALDFLCEAMEDDRWSFAEASELAALTGLSDVEDDIEGETEDLLASLSPAPATESARWEKRPIARPESEASLDAVIGEMNGWMDTDAGEDRLPSEPTLVTNSGRDEAAFSVPVASVAAMAGRATLSHVVPIARAATVDSVDPAATRTSAPAAAPMSRSVPIDLVDAGDVPRLTSRVPGVLGLLAMGALGYFVYHQYTQQQILDASAAAQADQRKRDAAEAQRVAIEDLPDPGTIRVTSNPPQAGVWLKVGRTPVTSMPLSSTMMHELRFEGVDGYDPVDTQVVAANWTGSGARRAAAIAVALPRVRLDPRTGKAAPAELPPMPPKPPASASAGYSSGRGAIQITSTPPGAEVWMYIGMTNGVELSGIQSGLGYELRLLADGYLPGFISVTPDEWRSGGDPTVPIDRARKRAILEKSIDLVATSARSR